MRAFEAVAMSMETITGPVGRVESFDYEHSDDLDDVVILSGSTAKSRGASTCSIILRTVLFVVGCMCGARTISLSTDDKIIKISVRLYLPVVFMRVQDLTKI